MNTKAVIIGQRIRRRREVLGWSRVRFAKEIGVAPSTVARWELGERCPLLSRWKGLANKLGMQPEILFSDDDTRSTAMDDLSRDLMLTVARSGNATESQKLAAARSLARRPATAKTAQPGLAKFRTMMDEARDSFLRKIARIRSEVQS